MNQLDEREIALHVSILGWLYIAANALFIVFAVFALWLLPTLGAVSRDPDATVVLSIMGTAFGGLMLVLGLPGVIAGYGLLKHRPWARTLAIVLGVLGLVNFPVGTAIGIYTLLVLLQRSANDFFIAQKIS
jgi:hypothetical protein